MHHIPPLRFGSLLPMTLLALLSGCGTSPERGEPGPDTPDTDVSDTTNDANPSDIGVDSVGDLPDADSCDGSPPLCSYSCGGDAFEAAACLEGRWVCPAGTTPIDDCPPGSCFGAPFPGEVCDDGWQCRPPPDVLPACGAPAEMLCADCRGFDTTVHSREDCECSCEDGMVECGVPVGACETWSESDLPGVRIELQPLDDCEFTLAEVRSGLSFAYGVTAAAGHEQTTSAPLDDGGCGRPVAPGLTLFAEIGGNGQRWCLCDVGLCPNPGDANVVIAAGTARYEVAWNGTNWTGPSDFGNPEGPAFPPGDYTIEVSARGTWDAGVGREADPYAVVGGMRFRLVE